VALLTICHTTAYRYANPVSFGEHRLMFRPRDSHDIRLVSTALEIAPTASVRWYHDVFGNSIAIASFAEPAAELRLVSRITLEHFPSSLPDYVIAEYARTSPFSYSVEDIPDLGRTTERHYPDPEHRIDVWARQFVAHGGSTDTHAMLVAMTRGIQASFAYRRRAEEGTQTPVETLARSAGSCRDLALLMMEAARTLGLAARFVSGYLYDPERRAVGGGETHAWVQIYLPGAGWVEFDPTNGIVGGSNLIRVAVTRDPRQAIPVSGSFVGAPGDFIGLEVEVAISQGA
jgi:transglutaminase-like putative cysteine protease